MKKKTLKSKIFLNKQTVASLSNNKLNSVNGGAATYKFTCDCTVESCYINCISDVTDCFCTKQTDCICLPTEVNCFSLMCI